MENLNGLLLINKPQNMTSFDVVAQLRKKLHIKKIGHSGTLDPMAEGVLLVLVGKATKILPFLENSDKEYVAEFILGKQTDTEDVWGNVVERKEIKEIENLEQLCQKFIGPLKQLPPMVSSIKINGKKLYEYAREGIEIERPLREIEIYDIQVLSSNKIKVHCSSGTYIRSLIRDIAIESGNIGCMSSLVRTKVGNFTLEDCMNLEDVNEENVSLISIYDALSYMECIEVADPFDVKNGKKIHLKAKSERVLMTYNKQALAIYKHHHKDVYACERGLG